MPNANEQVLAQLKDIHMPEAIGWWPPAPGWFVLLFLCIAGVVVLMGLSWRWYVNSLSKRQALNLLSEYKKQYQADHHAQKACARLSELLKRVALVYYPRNNVAGLTGRDWVKFLDETSNIKRFSRFEYELAELPYAKDSERNRKPSKSVDALFNTAHVWIKQRRKRCLN